MKKIFYILIPAAVITLLIVKLKSNKEITEEKIFHYNKDEAIRVSVDTISLIPADDDHTWSGTFEPGKESKLSAEVQGKINEIPVEIGTQVKKGQTLIQLDNALLKLQLQSSEVQIEGLENDIRRYLALAKADAIQGIQLEKAELALKTAKVQSATIQEQINKSFIKAPFDGVITAKLSEEGAFAAPGVPLIQLTDISHLKFTINVSETDLNYFDLNKPAQISCDAYPENKLTANVTLIGSKANTGNSFPIQFNLNNTGDEKIKSGMFGKVLLQKSTGQKEIIIPASACIETEGKTQVYKVVNGKAVLWTITIKQKLKNKNIVERGLIEGDVIVTNGFINLFDQANIRVK